MEAIFLASGPTLSLTVYSLSNRVIPEFPKVLVMKGNLSFYPSSVSAYFPFTSLSCTIHALVCVVLLCRWLGGGCR